METIQISSLRNHLSVRKDKLSKAIREIPSNPKLIGLLREVDSALEKINQGSFGICEVCHEHVEEDRILIDPLISVCLGCMNESQQRLLEDDLEFAAKIQRNLLPKNNQSVSGWKLSYFYNPAGPVSGDFVDFIPMNDGSAIFVLGDVSGKGISASLMMSHLHALIRSLILFELPVNEIIQKANRLFCESTLYTNYATMIIGKAFPDGKIEIAVAGHNPPLIIKEGAIDCFRATGFPVGLFSESEYTTENFSLEKDDALLLYTDGLTESTFDGTEYGENRVKELLVKSDGKSVIEKLVNDQKNFLKDSDPSDDTTIMVLKRS